MMPLYKPELKIFVNYTGTIMNCNILCIVIGAICLISLMLKWSDSDHTTDVFGAGSDYKY